MRFTERRLPDSSMRLLLSVFLLPAAICFSFLLPSTPYFFQILTSFNSAGCCKSLRLCASAVTVWLRALLASAHLCQSLCTVAHDSDKGVCQRGRDGVHCAGSSQT